MRQRPLWVEADLTTIDHVIRANAGVALSAREGARLQVEEVKIGGRGQN